MTENYKKNFIKKKILLEKKDYIALIVESMATNI